ncbi:DUF397 domain-containing protein [Streptomyces sp. 11-1-2]|uniref:DUF397 domain-containing protein n=1 Tax=unclassified Streptomyces TaxID=2593676 RepID=UPI000B8DAB1F|nr:DUF397 domain-containing protein [Streptomyces sp. 11-1-2]ASQ97552.1 DUF397 domain-containing protein [Streptomyces sp. 11-1-2]
MSRPAKWRKSSFSGNGEDNHCVELLPVDGKIKLRESDTPADILTTTPGPLGTFIRAVKAGALDRLGQ